MAREVVLNNNDNWLPDSMRWAAFISPESWRRHLGAYFDAITTVFEGELQRVAAQPEQSMEWSQAAQTFNLHLSETYWEFSSDNPTALVASLKPLVDSFTAGNREAAFFRQDCDVGIDHNAPYLQARINTGRSIRIYAKTNRRLRIEVVHTFGQDGYSLSGGHTGTTWQQLPDLLGRLAEDAATLVNRLFAHFRGQRSLAPHHIPSFQLLLEICQHARQQHTASIIATALVHNGCIATGGMGEQVQRALQRLSGAGVLEYHPPGRTYTVTASRRAALEMLQEHGSFPFLTCRVRTRANPPLSGDSEENG